MLSFHEHYIKDIKGVEAEIRTAEEDFGIPEGRTLIMAAIESARGVVKCRLNQPGTTHFLDKSHLVLQSTSRSHPVSRYRLFEQNDSGKYVYVEIIIKVNHILK